jgi:O-antigen ligase
MQGISIQEPTLFQPVAPPGARTLRSRVRGFFRTGSRWITVAVGFALPLSTSATELLIVVLVVFWLLSGQLRAKAAWIAGNRVVWLALAMFGLFAVGVSYSLAPRPIALDTLFHYRKLLCIPIFATVFVDPPTRRRAIIAFEIAMLVTLAASFLMWWGLIDTKWGNPGDCAVFKNHINQNVLMAFLVAVLAWQMAARPKRRWLLGILLALAVFNILFMVDGRTGYLILFALVALWMLRRYGVRGAALAAVAVAVLGGGAYVAAENFRERTDLAVREVADYFRAGRDTPDSSMGERLLFYKVSAEVILQRPLLGAGTGSFGTELLRFDPDRLERLGAHPHCGYFSIGVQTGLLGLSLFFFWLYTQWRDSRRLSPELIPLAQALIVTFVAGSLFNSFLSTTTEAHLYGYFLALCFSTLPQAAAADRATAPLEDRPPAAGQVQAAA